MNPPHSFEYSDVKKYWIYGFRAKDGTMLYVGHTLNAKLRETAHLWKRPFLREANFVILREAEVNKFKIHLIEAQIIEAFKRRGQCQMNRDRGGHLAFLRFAYGEKPSYLRHLSKRGRRSVLSGKTSVPQGG